MIEELKKRIRNAGTESSEKREVQRELESHGHRKHPESHQATLEDRRVVRMYLWRATPLGHLCLVTGPSVEPSLYELYEAAPGEEPSEVYFPSKRGKPALTVRTNPQARVGKVREAKDGSKYVLWRPVLADGSRPRVYLDAEEPGIDAELIDVMEAQEQLAAGKRAVERRVKEAKKEGKRGIFKGGSGRKIITGAPKAKPMERAASRTPLFDSEGKEYLATYMVIPAHRDGMGDLRSSNLPGSFEETPHYPTVFQARSLQRLGETRKIEKIAANLDAERVLLPHSDATLGTPVVWEGDDKEHRIAGEQVYTPKGTYYVLGGNGRAIAILMAPTGKYQSYSRRGRSLWSDVWPAGSSPAGTRDVLVRLATKPDGTPLSFAQARTLAGRTQKSASGEESPIGKALSLIRSLGIERVADLPPFVWKGIITQDNVEEFQEFNPAFARAVFASMGAARAESYQQDSALLATLFNDIMVGYLPRRFQLQGFVSEKQERALLAALPIIVAIHQGVQDRSVQDKWDLFPLLDAASRFAQAIKNKSDSQAIAMVEAAASQIQMGEGTGIAEKFKSLFDELPLLGVLFGLVLKKAEKSRDPALTVEKYLTPYAAAAFDPGESAAQSGLFAAPGRPDAGKDPTEILATELGVRLPRRMREATVEQGRLIANPKFPMGGEKKPWAPAMVEAIDQFPVGAIVKLRPTQGWSRTFPHRILSDSVLDNHYRVGTHTWMENLQSVFLETDPVHPETHELLRDSRGGKYNYQVLGTEDVELVWSPEPEPDPEESQQRLLNRKGQLRLRKAGSRILEELYLRGPTPYAETPEGKLADGPQELLDKGLASKKTCIAAEHTLYDRETCVLRLTKRGRDYAKNRRRAERTHQAARQGKLWNKGPHYFDELGELGAPSIGEKGYKPAPDFGNAYGGQTPYELADRLVGNAEVLMEEPELYWAYCAELPEACGGLADSDFSLADMLQVPFSGPDGKRMTEAERAGIALSALAVTAEALPDRWSGEKIILGERKSRKGPTTLIEARRGDSGEVPMWAATAALTDWLASLVPGYSQVLRLVNIDKKTAQDFIEKHHSALPYLNARGLLFALGLMKGSRLVAVATVNSNTANLSKTRRVLSGELDVKDVLELTRVASDGSVKGAASKLVARVIDIMEQGKRSGGDAPALLMTYQLATESGTTYKALKDKGLRPVAEVKGSAPSGARGGDPAEDRALAQVDKIRWECCVDPPAMRADWDILGREQKTLWNPKEGETSWFKGDQVRFTGAQSEHDGFWQAVYIDGHRKGQIVWVYPEHAGVRMLHGEEKLQPRDNPKKSPPGSFKSWEEYYLWKMNGINRAMLITEDAIRSMDPERANMPGGAVAHYRTLEKKRRDLLEHMELAGVKLRNPGEPEDRFAPFLNAKVGQVFLVRATDYPGAPKRKWMKDTLLAYRVYKKPDISAVAPYLIDPEGAEIEVEPVGGTKGRDGTFLIRPNFEKDKLRTMILLRDKNGHHVTGHPIEFVRHAAGHLDLPAESSGQTVMFNPEEAPGQVEFEFLGAVPVLHFASGTNRPGSIRGFADLGKAVGSAFASVDKKSGRWVRECRGPCLEELARAASLGIPVFLDSGAFSEVDFPEDGPPVVAVPIPEESWAERFDVYRYLADAGGKLANVVAPDMVGHQVESFQRLSAYKDEVNELLDMGASVLVPLQLGPIPLHEYHDQVDELLGRKDWIPALPFQNAATSPTQLGEYLRKKTPVRLHLLGIGPRKKAATAVAQEIRENSPGTQVQMDSVVIKAHVGRKRRKTGDPRGEITAAQDEAREQLLEERYIGSQRESVPDYTDLVGMPSSWASEAALKRLSSAAQLSSSERKELIADPDEFFQRETFAGIDHGIPFYLELEQPIELELGKRFHSLETFEAQRMGIREGLKGIYPGGQEYITNPEQEEGHVPGIDTPGHPGLQMGLFGGASYSDEQTASPGRITILNMGLGRDSLTMLCLLADGELVWDGKKHGPEDVDAVVFSDTGGEWKHTMDLIPKVEKFAKKHGIRWLNLQKPQAGTKSGELRDSWLQAMKTARQDREQGWAEVYREVIAPMYREKDVRLDEIRAEKKAEIKEKRAELKNQGMDKDQMAPELDAIREKYAVRMKALKKKYKAKAAEIKKEGGFAGKAERAWWAPQDKERRLHYGTIEERAAAGVYHLRPEILVDFAWKGTIPLRDDKSCTGNHKVAPIRKVTEDLAIEKFGPWATNTKWGSEVRDKKRLPHLNLIGLAADETDRLAKGGDVGCFEASYVTEAYPLEEMGIAKNDEQPYLDSCGFGETRKSGCWLCPYQPLGWWWALSVLHPDKFERAAQAEYQATLRDPKLYFIGRKKKGKSLSLAEAVKVWREENPDASPEEVLDKQYAKCKVKFGKKKNPVAPDSCCPDCNRFVDLWNQFGEPGWLERYGSSSSTRPNTPASGVLVNTGSKLSIQSLSFDRALFNKTEATRWARQHGFSVPKVHLTPNLIKIRQTHPSKFKRGSFRTKSLTEGVKAIVGVPR